MQRLPDGMPWRGQGKRWSTKSNFYRATLALRKAITTVLRRTLADFYERQFLPRFACLRGTWWFLTRNHALVFPPLVNWIKDSTSLYRCVPVSAGQRL